MEPILGVMGLAKRFGPVEVRRSVLPVPGLFFLVLIGTFIAILRATTFGRYVDAIGGNTPRCSPPAPSICPPAGGRPPQPIPSTGSARNHEDITLVYGHDDPMAYGAYLAANDAGREQGILFLGVDALPDEGLQQGLKLLAGEPIERPTACSDTGTTATRRYRRVAVAHFSRSA